MNLRRGTPVIIMDCEEPSARMVSVLARYDDKKGTWFGLYLSTFPNMTLCHTTSWTPTPIADFGMMLEVNGNQFRCVPSGKPSRATYEDSKPRKWQDRFGDRWWDTRPNAPALLDPNCFRRFGVAA